MTFDDYPASTDRLGKEEVPPSQGGGVMDEKTNDSGICEDSRLPNLEEVRDEGTPEMEIRGHDELDRVVSLVNYRPSGHALMKDKGVLVVNRRPPTMPSNAWASIGPVHKLACLNAYRRTLNLREAKTWDDMVVYLTEEHLPSKLPANHKFPWGARAPNGNSRKVR